MAVKVTSVKLGNEFNAIQTSWPKHVIGEKIPFRIEYDVETGVKFYTDNVLTYAPEAYISPDHIQSESFVFQQFYKGDKIKITDAVNSGNNGEYVVIDKIDERTLRIEKSDGSAASFTENQESNDCIIEVIDVVDKCKFFFNFIENNEPVNFFNKETSSVQEYIQKSLIDAEDTSTSIELQATGKKFWQIAEDMEVTGNGVGTSEYGIRSSSFIITGTLVMTPFILAAQWDDTVDRIAPAYYLNGKALKLAYRIEASYKDRSDQYFQYYEESLVLGDTGWFNEKFNNKPTSYEIDSVTFTNPSGENKLQLTTDSQTVVIVIKNTVDDPFIAGQKVCANFCIAHKNEEEYNGVNVQNNKLDYNFRWDRAIVEIDGSAAPGEQDGVSGRQVFTSVEAVLDSAEQVTITATIEFDEDLVEYFEDTDINGYLTWVTVDRQDSSYPMKQIQDVDVGDQPTVIAVDTSRNRVFVSNLSDSSVSVIDCNTLDIVTTIPSVQAEYMFYDDVEDEVYCSYGSSIKVIDCSSFSITTITGGGMGTPKGIARSHSDNLIYVCDSANDNLVVIDPATHAIIDFTPTVCNTPVSICENTTNGFLYVGSQTDGTVTHIEPSVYNIGTPITVGTNPDSMAYFSDNDEMYVCNNGSHSVSVIDCSGDTVSSTISSAGNRQIALNTVRKEMVCAHSDGNSVKIISTSSKTVIDSIAVGTTPYGVAYNASYNRVFVVNQFSDNVSVIGASEDGNERVALLVDASDFYIDHSDPTMLSITSKFLDHTKSDPAIDGTTTIKTAPEDEVVAYSEFYIDKDGREDDEILINSITTKIKAKNSVTGDEFDLDPFNLPIVDQDIDFSLDRVFHVPSDEIRKKIVIQRRTDLDILEKEYYSVLFPFKVRWEYWEKLLGVNTAFLDITEPNKGYNHEWHRYSTVANWGLYYEIIIEGTKNGHDFTYTDEKQITSYDYDSNSDWAPTTIKSYDGSTELISAGKQFILGYKDTKIVAKFVDASGDALTLSNYEVNILVEMFEAGGINGQRRMSSAWASDSDTWFKSIDTSNKTVLSLATTNSANDTILATVNIDYKLLPASTKFKVTARLYDLDGDTNVGGYCIAQEFYYAAANPEDTTTVTPIDESNLNECCRPNIVLADVADDNEFKTDRTSFTWSFPDIVDDASLGLLKWNGTEWEVVYALSSNAYGTLLAYGDFINDANEKFISYELNWALVLDDFGAGKYKVQVAFSSPMNPEATKDSEEYCLHPYSASRADGTIRIEYYLNGIIGDNTDDLKVRDYGTLNLYNSIRIPGWFGFPNSKYTKEYTKYYTGARKYTKDEQEQEFELMIKRVGANIHELMRTDVLQADEVLITDYNRNNAQKWVQKSVQFTGDYPPNWKRLLSKLAEVKLTCRAANNNYKKYRN